MANEKPVAKAQAQDDDSKVEAVANAVAGLTVDQLSQLILNNNIMAQAMLKLAEASENGPIKQIPLAKAKIRTPWNPEGLRDDERPELAMPTYLNGFRLRESLLSSLEIELLNKVRNGKYNRKRWTVIVKQGEEEGSGGEKIIYIPNKTQADRIRLAQDSVHPTEPKKNGLVAILERMIEEGSQIVLATS